MKPIRIQRKRTKGWRMPENTVYVGRGSKWGNPYSVYKLKKTSSRYNRGKWCVLYSAGRLGCDIYWFDDRATAINKAIEEFKEKRLPYLKQFISDLKGKNLSCWCKLSDPCHSDVLLELANPEE